MHGQGSRRVRQLLVLAGLLVCLNAQALEGVVVRVTDGDTLWLRTHRDKRPMKVRLHGIDAPELCQPGGVQARQALESLVLGRRVVVQPGPADSYGRRLARVHAASQDVAQQLVSAGWAWSPDYRGRPGPYAGAERAARAARLGVFADPQAVPPRAFRQAHGSCVGPAPPHATPR